MRWRRGIFFVVYVFGEIVVEGLDVTGFAGGRRGFVRAAFGGEFFAQLLLLHFDLVFHVGGDDVAELLEIGVILVVLVEPVADVENARAEQLAQREVAQFVADAFRHERAEIRFLGQRLERRHVGVGQHRFRFGLGRRRVEIGRVGLRRLVGERVAHLARLELAPRPAPKERFVTVGGHDGLPAPGSGSDQFLSLRLVFLIAT